MITLSNEEIEVLSLELNEFNVLVLVIILVLVVDSLISIMIRIIVMKR